MTDMIKEFCGVFGVSCNDYGYSVASIVYPGLMAIQHRGQIFSGISMTSCEGKISSYKNWGLVSKVLKPKKLKEFSGNVGIGHVCYGYPTCTNIDDAQPFHFKTQQTEFSIAINGIILNYDEIQENLNNSGRIISGKSDIELLATLIETLSKFSDNMIEVLSKVMNMVKGAYSLILLDNRGNLYAMRDPSGYKPLCYGVLEKENKVFYMISSESCSLDVLGAKLLRDVNPGEIIKSDPIIGLTTYQIKTPINPGICQFEYVYFARPDSIIDGVSVGSVRFKLGVNLAREEDFKSEEAIVVPIPDSGRSAAMGYSWKSKVPYEEGLMKNRYLWHLKSKVEDKLNPIKPIVQGKDVILIDDSIISGNTMKKIIAMLREQAEVRSVHVRISCPPIIKSCDLNPSISNRETLIAYKEKLKNYTEFNEIMRNFINADSLRYQSLGGLINAIGKKDLNICTNCLKEYCDISEEIQKSRMEFHT